MSELKIWKRNGKSSYNAAYCITELVWQEVIGYTEITLDELVAFIAPGKVLVDKESVIEKPSWDDAPEWANWLARDSDGTWFWYAKKPELSGTLWAYKYNKYESAANNFIANWKSTLEPRPEPAPPAKSCGTCAYWTCPTIGNAGVCRRNDSSQWRNYHQPCHTLLDDVVLVPGMEVEQGDGNTAIIVVAGLATGRLGFIANHMVHIGHTFPVGCTVGKWNKTYVDDYKITAVTKFPEE